MPSRQEGSVGELWKHQAEAIDYAASRQWSIWHLGMGTGKTRAEIEVVRNCAAGGGGTRFLVVCPKAVIAAQVKQFSLWAPEIRVVALDRGTSRDKERRLSTALADTSPLVVIVNYETAWRMPLIEQTPWAMLVYDEVHRLKAPSGAASRWAARMGKKNPTAKRLGLTGTLLAHSPLDLWAIYRAMEAPNLTTWGETYTAFKARYAVCNPRIPGMVTRFIRQDELAEKLAATTFHRRSEDVLDLPEILHERLEFELSPEEARVHRELETALMASIGDAVVAPPNALGVALRMRQVCSGHVRRDEEQQSRPIEATPNKASRFGDWLEDLPPREPLVVFAVFTEDLRQIRLRCEESGRRVSELSGRCNELASWQAGDTDVLITQIQSGGIGVDLTRAAYGVFYSVGYELSTWLQAIARLHRPGQTRTTRLYAMVAKLPNNRMSIEDRIHAALINRRDAIEEIVNVYRRAPGATVADCVAQ